MEAVRLKWDVPLLGGGCPAQTWTLFCLTEHLTSRPFVWVCFLFKPVFHMLHLVPFYKVGDQSSEVLSPGWGLAGGCPTWSSWVSPQHKVLTCFARK